MDYVKNNINDVLENAVLAGKILLESGAETYRVEETIQRIALNCGMDDAQAFVLPTGIMTTITLGKENATKIIRVKNRSINLDKIDQINALSRELMTTKYDVETIRNRLLLIQDAQQYPFSWKLLSAAIGSGAFALLFKGSMIDAIISFFAGMIVYSIKFFADKLGINFFIATTLASFCSIIFSILLTQSFGNTDIVIISMLMLLVPGLVITNAVRDSVAQDLGAAVNRLLETILIATAIALGAIIAIALAKAGGLTL